MQHWSKPALLLTVLSKSFGQLLTRPASIKQAFAYVADAMPGRMRMGAASAKNVSLRMNCSSSLASGLLDRLDQRRGRRTSAKRHDVGEVIEVIGFDSSVLAG
ncbi:hypothetical protein [Pararhizobium sp. PWRC1-1]|uniref:hypothetical protein n=1 Tax=Pararhizobium sp. PWRC1-1 TaxID=2804566 RepID=UPI003CF6D97F